VVRGDVISPRLAGIALGLAVLAGARATTASDDKPWCAPEVSELSDHVCYYDGGLPSDGRRTLVIYLHGMLATTPGFQYLQQRAMAMHAKKHGFTVLLPTSPKVDGSYMWPTSIASQKDQEAQVLAGIDASRRKLEKKLGHKFDETFIVGFSSGAYYASSLALRGAIDVDGYIVLAGAASWQKGDPPKRAPIFVGVSAADSHTAPDSRGLAGTLAALSWPYRVEERNTGHMVDWTFMAHGIAWLRGRMATPSTMAARE
jgi:predicted esterase